MTFADVRTELSILLKTVSGIGEVHEYRRLAKTWEKIFRQHKKEDQGRINSWEISRSEVIEEIDTVQNRDGVEPCFRDEHLVVITGYMSVNDEKESEKTFQDLIDNIIKVIRENITLNQKVLIPRPASATTIEHRMFGPVFVHFTEIELLAIQRVGG